MAETQRRRKRPRFSIPSIFQKSTDGEGQLDWTKLVAAGLTVLAAIYVPGLRDDVNELKDDVKLLQEQEVRIDDHERRINTNEERLDKQKSKADNIDAVLEDILRRIRKAAR